jgi:anoctamin-7
MILVLVFIIAVILYRVLISIPLFQNPLLRSRALTIASLSAAIVNLTLIMSLGKVYEKLAEKLTQWGKWTFCLLFSSRVSSYNDVLSVVVVR